MENVIEWIMNCKTYGDGSGDSSGAGRDDCSGYGSSCGRFDGSGYGDILCDASGSETGYGYGYGSDFGNGNDDGSGYGKGYDIGYGSGYGIKMINGNKVYTIDNIRCIIKKISGNTAKGCIINDDLTTKNCYVARCYNSFKLKTRC